MLRALVADDDQALRLAVKSALLSTGKFAVEEAFDGINALEKFKAAENPFEIVILDVDMPRLNGLETLKQIKELSPGTIVIMVTAHATLNDAVSAVKDGAYNYVSKPVSGEQLVEILEKALLAQRMITNIAASAPVMVQEGRKIIGNTQLMQRVFNIIHRLAKVDTPVLIRGASGTGKELVAKAIHFNSARKDEKFVAINCSAIPENLFESELFGHEKGSFTGASERKLGKFQFAEGGTLFLDEVGDMPAPMQVKILRVLQEKIFTPVGSNRDIQSNVRIIAATNRPLEDMIKAGTFREDLFYRLNVVPIFLPSLSERLDDIERLVHIFVRKFNEQHKRRMTSITPDALNVLKKYSWPGNIRELENVIEYCFVMEPGNTLSIGSLPESILAAVGVDLIESSKIAALQNQNNSSSTDADDSIDESNIGLDDADESSEGMMDSSLSPEDAASLDFNAQKESFEKEFILKALKHFKGRINQTAMHANIPKKTLLRKIEKYGINAKDFSD